MTDISMAKVFISYLRRDRFLLEGLYDALSFGANCVSCGIPIRFYLFEEWKPRMKKSDPRK